MNYFKNLAENIGIFVKSGGIVNIENFILEDSQQNSRLSYENLLIKEVKAEITSRLTQSLHENFFIDLPLKECFQLIKPSWDVRDQFDDRVNRNIDSNTNILNIFNRDDIQGKLLIVGEAGSGKTTTLLHLAQSLIEEADKSYEKPIPVIVDLFSWSQKQQSIPEWLVEEVATKYCIADKKNIKKLLDNHKLLPLFDGLDEVQSECQESCIKALNKLISGQIRNTTLGSYVICCRIEAIKLLQEEIRIRANGAIFISKLSEKKILDYLNSIRKTELWSLISQNPMLKDLVSVPLFLYMLVSTEEIAPQLKKLQDPKKAETLLIKTFINKKLGRIEKKSDYNRWQVSSWLIWIAQHMENEGKRDFLVENIQPTWINNEEYLRSYKLQIQLIYALILGLIGWLAFAPSTGIIVALVGVATIQMDKKRSIAIIAATIGALSGIYYSADLRYFIPTIVIGIRFGLSFVIAIWLSRWITGITKSKSNQWFIGIISWVIAILVFRLTGFGEAAATSIGLIFGLIAGITSSIRNQWMIGIISIIAGLISGIIQYFSSTSFEHLLTILNNVEMGLLFGLLFGLIVERKNSIERKNKLLFGIIIGITSGLLIGLKSGVIVLINQHTPNFVVVAIVLGLFNGIIGGLTVGLIGGIISDKNGMTFGINNKLLAAGLIGGLIFGLTYGLPSLLSNFLQRLFDFYLLLFRGLVSGLTTGIIVGMSGGLSGGLNNITPIEGIFWSWKRAIKGLISGLIVGMIAGIIAAIILGLGSASSIGLGVALLVAPILMVIYGLSSGIIGREVDLEQKISINQGIKRSLRMGLLQVLIFSLSVGIIAWLSSALMYWMPILALNSEKSVMDTIIMGLRFERIALISGLDSGIRFGLMTGLSSGLGSGLGVFIKHVILRRVLYKNCFAPKNYDTFLTSCSENRLLQQVGGRFRFIHKTVQEHLAMMKFERLN